MEEIWKDIEGYEGYQVSSFGNIKSLHYCNTDKEHLLAPIENKKHYRVILNGDSLWVHRIVAFAFPEICGEYFEGAIINHKDERPENNRADNLEWCTYKYNRNYGSCSEKIRQKLTNRKDCSKPVIQLDKDGNQLNEYPSAMEVQRALGYQNQHIIACCKGKIKTAYGFKWQYAA